MKFFNEVGRLAMGSRIRCLAETISSDAAKIYKEYGSTLKPKWFPVFYVLSKGQADTVGSIAEYVGHSHASISKIMGELSKRGLIVEKPDPKDRRKIRITLSKAGRQIAQNIEQQYDDVEAAVDELSSQATHDLWVAIEEWEYLLHQKSLHERVREKKKQRQSAGVKIESFKPKYKEAFRRLNEDWITKHFKIEKPDRDALENPKSYILDRGGHIFVATLDGRPVGVCALLKREDEYGYELAKMAVAPEARGKNIGYLLGQAVIEKTISLKGRRLYLESNTRLKPAIRLYEKLGFKKIVGPPTPYARANIQMLWEWDGHTYGTHGVP